MAMTLSQSEALLYSTTLLQTEYPTGRGSGTAFFWLSESEIGNALALVTNRHVIEGATALNVTFHVGEDGMPTGRYAHHRLELAQTPTIFHPDPAIDLAAIPIGGVCNELARDGSPVFFQALSKSMIPGDEDWSDFGAFEEVLMIGCPRGLSDSVNHMPLVRRGLTATSVSRRYEGRDEFMVDMACYPGSSGSPVFSYQQGLIKQKGGFSFTGGSKAQLLGVLYAGPLITNKGVILSQQPTVEVASMMHLGQVIRATQLAALDQTMIEMVRLEMNHRQR